MEGNPPGSRHTEHHPADRRTERQGSDDHRFGEEPVYVEARIGAPPSEPGPYRHRPTGFRRRGSFGPRSSFRTPMPACSGSRRLSAIPMGSPSAIRCAASVAFGHWRRAKDWDGSGSSRPGWCGKLKGEGSPRAPCAPAPPSSLSHPMRTRRMCPHPRPALLSKRPLPLVHTLSKQANSGPGSQAGPIRRSHTLARRHSRPDLALPGRTAFPRLRNRPAPHTPVDGSDTALERQ